MEKHARTSLQLTKDGSHTLISTPLGVSYHSTHGAIQESNHVFLHHGLSWIATQFSPVQVLEIGFGSGLNALMTRLLADQNKISVQYTAIEGFPISLEIAKQLNYPRMLELEDPDIFLNLHTQAWNTTHRYSDLFTLEKRLQLFSELELLTRYHCIYFDAFAPNAQPSLWEALFLEKMFEALLPGGVLTTYCAKGEVKRTLKAIGFMVEALPGPPGKREMTRAIKPKA